MGKLTKKPKCQHLTPQQRRFILRSIAEYKQTPQIMTEIAARWPELNVSPVTVDANYRHNAAYREQIAKYRAGFNAKEREHPLFNRQIMLSYLQRGMDIAIEDRDGKALASLINQAKDITGMGTPTELEVTHHNGAQSFEDILRTALNGVSDSAVDVQVDPAPLPAIPAEIVKPSIDASFQD